MMAFRTRHVASNRVSHRDESPVELAAIIEAKPSVDHHQPTLPKRWYNLDVVLTDDFPRR